MQMVCIDSARNIVKRPRLPPVTLWQNTSVTLNPAVAACGGSCPLELPGTIVNVPVLAGGME